MLSIQEWAEIAAPIVGPIVAAAFAVWQFQKQKAKEGRIRALEIDRAWSALLDVRNLVDATFPPGRVYPTSEDQKNEAIPLAVLDDAFSKDSALLTGVKVILGHWEALALTVFAGASDEQMAYELISHTLVGYMRRFENFVKRRQQQESHSLYVHFVALAKKWELALPNYTPTFLPRGSSGQA